MTKKWLIIGFAFGLAGCASSQLPMDDAYYRPDPETALPVTRHPSPVTPNPSIEYISVQDTTVTIRIRK